MALFLAVALQSEVQVSVYAGQGWTLDSDVRYQHQTFEDTSWDADPTFGARVGYFFGEWGLALDVFRAEAELDDPVDGVDALRLSDYILITANVIYRLEGPLTPYIGVGLGIALASVEADVGTEGVDDRQLEAPAAQGFLGVLFGFVFVEAKLAWSDPELDIPGDRFETHLLMPQLVAGLTISF